MKGIRMAKGADQRQNLSEAIYFSAQRLIIFTAHYTKAKDPCVLQPVTSFNTLKQNGRHTSARPNARFHISESIRQECLSNAALGRSTSTSSRPDLALRHCKTICLPHQSEAHFVFHLCSSACRNTWSAHFGFIHSAKLKIKPILPVSGPFI